MKPVIAYVITVLSLLAADFVWLSLTGETLYRPAMGELMRQTADLKPAVGFYALYALAITWLVTLPATATDGPVNRVALSLKGAVLALAAFGTYDLTGMAVIRAWPFALSFIDMGWGVVTTVIAANVTATGLKLLRQTG